MRPAQRLCAAGSQARGGDGVITPRRRRLSALERGHRHVYYPWGNKEAASYVAGLGSFGKRYGYMFALYGSSLAGRGRDLDMLAVPFSTRACSPDALLDALRRHVSGSEPWGRHKGLMGMSCGLFQLPDGKILDVQVCQLRCGEEEA